MTRISGFHTQPSLTIDVELRKRLRKAADEHQCTLNAEMRRRLEHSFDVENLRTIESVAAKMKRMIDA